MFRISRAEKIFVSSFLSARSDFDSLLSNVISSQRKEKKIAAQ